MDDFLLQGTYSSELGFITPIRPAGVRRAKIEPWTVVQQPLSYAVLLFNIVNIKTIYLGRTLWPILTLMLLAVQRRDLANR